jgi:L-cysteine desulfidase
MVNQTSSLLEILRSEVKPALGCTGPVAVAFAVAVAKDAVGGIPRSVRVLMDKDTYVKNCAVGIPGIDTRGIPIASALGAVAGVSEAGLEVLKKVTPADAESAKALLPSVSVDIKWDFDGVGLYIETWVESDRGTGHALVAKKHDQVIFAEVDGNLVRGAYPSGFREVTDETRDPIREFSVEDLWAFALEEPLENLLFLREAVTLNMALANQGFQEGIGENFGSGFTGIPSLGPILKAKSMAASAADARMSGQSLPAMSCATSGNVGITASVPLVVMARELGLDEEKMLRAIALSFLLTIQVKSYIGRYSAFCACAIGSSIGVAGGMVLLLGGNARQADGAIRSVVGSTLGVLCDGAKHGCALKLSVAAGAAIDSAYLAMQGSAIRGGDGFVCETADETIRVMGRMAREGLGKADETMCRLIFERDREVAARQG